MKNYLNSLSERERWMVIGTIFCILLYFYYLFLYTPLQKQVTQKSTQLTEKINTLEWMRQVRHQKQHSKTQKDVDNSQLLTILATQLKENTTLKFPYQIQQTGAGDIQLTFDAVAFNLFITWLEKINQDYAIHLKQFNAERTATPGVARVVILLSAA